MSTQIVKNLPALILQLLKDSDKSLSGYDLSKMATPYWQQSHQQIYRELASLNRKGLVDYTDVPQTGKPDLKLYRINDAGVKALDDYVNAAISYPEPPKYRGVAMVMLAAKNYDYFEEARRFAKYRLKQLQEQYDEAAELEQKVYLSRFITLAQADVAFFSQVLELRGNES